MIVATMGGWRKDWSVELELERWFHLHGEFAIEALENDDLQAWRCIDPDCKAKLSFKAAKQAVPA